MTSSSRHAFLFLTAIAALTSMSAGARADAGSQAQKDRDSEDAASAEEAPGPMPAASFSYGHLPHTRLKNPPVGGESLQIGVNTYDASVAYPFTFNGGDTTLTTEVAYHQMTLHYRNWNRDTLGDVRAERVHSIRLTPTLVHNFSERWSMLAIVAPGIASEFQSPLSVDDLILEAAAAGIYKFSDRFSMGLGVGFNPLLGQQFPLPILAFSWNNGSNMKAEAILPLSANFAWRAHSHVDLGVGARLEGSSFHGDPGKYDVDNPQLRYSLVKVGPSVTVRPAPWLGLKVDGGYAFARRLEFYDGNDEQESYDLQSRAYVNLSLLFGSAE